MTWADAERVLCVRLDAMGDVLMTTPALRALRASGPPGRTITLLTSPSGAAVARLIPEIDATITYDAPWMKATAPRRDGAVDRDFIDRLRADRFDAAVIFTVYSQNPLPAAMLCHLADVPLRLAHCRENPYQLLTDRVAEVEPESIIRHEARRQLDLVATVGASTADERLSLRVPDSARAAIRDRLAGLNLDPLVPRDPVFPGWQGSSDPGEWPGPPGDRGLKTPATQNSRLPADRVGGIADSTRWAVVHPGATAPSRRYPPELFARAAGLMLEAGFTLLFTGEASESALVEAIRAEAGRGRTHSLADRLTLPEFAALVEAAPVLISNNTGPVHVASAVGTPVVDLYALTNLQHTPWLVPHRVLFHDVPCKLCYKSVCPLGHHDCLRLVPPEAVAAAAIELLQQGRHAPIPPFAFSGARG